MKIRTHRSYLQEMIEVARRKYPRRLVRDDKRTIMPEFIFPPVIPPPHIALEDLVIDISYFVGRIEAAIICSLCMFG